MDLTFVQWLILVFSALNVGFSKTGLQGGIMPAVVLMTLAFGGQLSSSIMLTMILIGDFFAVRRYKESFVVSAILKFIPSTTIGVVTGAIVGNMIDDAQFITLIGVIMLISIFALLLQESNRTDLKVNDNFFTLNIVGVLNGFASMVGNASGPIFNVYMLARELKKKEMVNLIAWIFVMLNLIKLPFHIFLWESFTTEVLKLGLILTPVIYVGSIAGGWLIEYVSEKTYRRLMIIITVGATIQLFF